MTTRPGGNAQQTGLAEKQPGCHKPVANGWSPLVRVSPRFHNLRDLWHSLVPCKGLIGESPARCVAERAEFAAALREPAVARARQAQRDTPTYANSILVVVAVAAPVTLPFLFFHGLAWELALAG